MDFVNIDTDKINWNLLTDISEAKEIIQDKKELTDDELTDDELIKELTDDELIKNKFENEETKVGALEKEDSIHTMLTKIVLEPTDSRKNEINSIKKIQNHNLEIDLLKKKNLEEEAIKQMYGHDNLETESSVIKSNKLKNDIKKLEKAKLNIINNNNILEQKQKELNNKIDFLNHSEEKLKNNIISLNKNRELIKEKFKNLSIDLFNLNNTFLSMQNDLNSI